MAVRLYRVVGNAADPELAEPLHALRHAGRVEYLTVPAAERSRKRFRLRTDKGTECAVALPRSAALEDGAVLELSSERAIVVEIEAPRWLTLEPVSSAAALELGFLAGHHHWRVRFSGSRLAVALEQARERYLERLEHLRARGEVRVIEDD